MNYMTYPGISNPYGALTLCETVRNHFKILPEEFYGSSRKNSAVFSRGVAMFFLYNNYPLSLVEIGEIFKRHHTTVIHNTKRVYECIVLPQADPVLHRYYRLAEAVVMLPPPPSPYRKKYVVEKDLYVAEEMTISL
jgi:hypothetical protein